MSTKLPAVQHARLGASSAPRWMNCPGSIRQSQGIEETTSDYAAEGTAAHELSEHALRENIDADEHLGEMIPVDMRDGTTKDFEVTEDMTNAVQVYVDYVRERCETLGVEKPLLERKFDLSVLKPPGDMFGTADCVLVIDRGRFIEVIDYKHGVGVSVDATENVQLMYYALGALLYLQENGLLEAKPEKFKITIVQPRGFHPDGTVRSYTFKYDELVAFKRTLFERAEMTLDENAPLVVGDHCRFCPALPMCPAQEAHAVEVAQSEFDTMVPPPPEHMSLDDMTVALNKSSIVIDWFNAIRSHIQTMLEAGEDVAGWKLVEKRAQRKWIDVDAAAAWCDTQVKEPYQEPKLKSPAQIEKDLKADLPRGQKKEAAKTLEESGHVIKESSGNTLAPTSDTRQAISSSTAEDEFTALPYGQ